LIGSLVRFYNKPWQDYCHRPFKGAIMTFYTAGPWKDREQVREIAEKLRAAGYTVNSRWLEVEDVADDDPKREQYLREQAINDLEDVFKADALLYVNSRKSEGKATELGVAIASLKPIVIVGGRENNVFLNLNIPAFPTIDEAITWMKAEEDAYVKMVKEKASQ
jgi:hypothetical protein